ncbi:unnamed protein product [Boreogadus saida]
MPGHVALDDQEDTHTSVCLTLSVSVSVSVLADHLLEHRFETLILEENVELFSLISPPGHCLGLWEVYSMVLVGGGLNGEWETPSQGYKQNGGTLD